MLPKASPTVTVTSSAAQALVGTSVTINVKVSGTEQHTDWYGDVNRGTTQFDVAVTATQGAVSVAHKLAATLTVQ